MKKYTNLFFDLDHTLWDTEKNSEETLLELIDDFELAEKGISNKDHFIEVYHKHNNELWEAYSKNLIPKDQVRHVRFLRTMEHFNISEETLIMKLSDEFVKRCPYKLNLIPDAKEVLEYLREKRYAMHIITNGFREVQHIKINSSGLAGFFTHIFISEEIGFLKPQKQIFEFALQKTACHKDNAMMIGDNFEVDIEGALNAGIDSVFYNPFKKPVSNNLSIEIRSLNQLQRML